VSPDQPFPRVETLPSPTGALLKLYVHEAPDGRAVIQVNPGLAEHAAR
jgi:hypothetical protein